MCVLDKGCGIVMLDEWSRRCVDVVYGFDLMKSARCT